MQLLRMGLGLGLLKSWGALFGGAGETSARLEGVPAQSFLPKRLVHLEVGLAGCHSYIGKVA